MRRYIIGFICGAIFFSGVSYAASENLVAKVSNYIVKVNGKQQKFTNKPVTINGKTYLALSDVAKAVGYSISLKNGVISLEKSSTTSPATESPVKATEDTSIQLQQLVYPVKLNINGKVEQIGGFGTDEGWNFKKDQNGKIYVLSSYAAKLILVAADELETWPYATHRTVDFDKINNYYVTETVYLSASEKYENITFYNKDRSKKYEISGKPDNLTSTNSWNGLSIVRVDELMSALAYNVQVTIDEINHEIVVKFSS